jgi:crotonobetainyl-CoA:carnitine CoA-transferase CaiB-like acyl-CoA transferase
MRNIVCGMRRAAGERPLLVNLASLWAGPLCAHLLGRLGARVIKVESIRRPDGSREGCRPFFDRLHQGQEMVALDFDHPADMAQLRALLLRADIIIEGSRPRALARRGIDAREIIAARPGRIWASITAYGRSGGGAARVGFGDDAAIAAGLALRDHSGFPVFVGDAIADPLAGLAATVHILSARAAGGGVLLDLPLAGAAAFVASAPLLPALPPAPDGRVAPLAVPLKFSPRQVSPARAAGADTARVLAEAS